MKIFLLIIRKFLYTKISRSTVYVYMHATTLVQVPYAYSLNSFVKIVIFGQKQTTFLWSNFQVHLLQNYTSRENQKANRVCTVEERLTSSSRQSLRRGHTVRTRGREVTIIISCGQTVVRLEMESG